MMVRSIQLDMECVVICYASAQPMSLGSSSINELCTICSRICEEYANECSNHEIDHCRHYVRICKQCAEERRKRLVIGAHRIS